MKNILALSFAFLIATVSIAQKIDRSKAPAPDPAPKIQLGDYETFMLDNGLKVFVVENHKNPRVSFRLFVDRDPVKEGEHAGMSDLMGDLLQTGTQTKTKAEIDKEVDFIGARLSTSSHGAYASSLSKHKETVLALMSDVILHPSFPEDELDKLKKQTINGLLANTTDPGAISKNVGQALMFGKDHPYGEVVTKETVETVNSEMCREFYSTYFKPNISYMIVVGDITKDDAQNLVTKYFADWKSGDVPKHTYATPTAPQATEVDFVDKTGAVQSTVNIIYPVNLKPGSEDVIPASVMNAILGNAGFMARLIQNIREDKAYTYGAYSSLSADELIGDFYAGAEVRNEVTDSTIVEFFYEMNRLTTEKVSDEELQDVKNYLNGRFARSLERPETVARFALNTARYHLPPNYYATYLEKLQSVTAEDVMEMAKKYLLANNAYILVVGNKDEVANKLKRFAADGEIKYFDAYGNPVSDAKPIPEGVTAQTVVDNFLNAIGSHKRAEEINTMDITMSTSMRGMPISLRQAAIGTDKVYMEVKSGDMLISKIVINGNSGKMSGMMGEKDLTSEQIEKQKESAVIVDELEFGSKKLNLVQIEEINGVEAYKLEVSDDNGSEYHFYDVNTGLKVAVIKTEEGVTSTSFYSDYQEVNGLKYPFHIIQDNGGQVMDLKVESAKLGEKVDPTLFEL